MTIGRGAVGQWFYTCGSLASRVQVVHVSLDLLGHVVVLNRHCSALADIKLGHRSAVPQLVPVSVEHVYVM